MSHNESMCRVYGVTLETVVRRILRVFDAATPSDVEEGARWYPNQGELAISLADGEFTLEQTASVLAALSPRTSWSRNVAGAVALIKVGPSAARDIGCMERNIESATRALTEGFGALSLKTAPKTSAFARNIAGDREAVTVDVWAARVAGIDEDLLSRKGAYDAVAHAYRLAARRRGVDPSTMQATTWVVARNGRAS